MMNQQYTFNVEFYKREPSFSFRTYIHSSVLILYLLLWSSIALSQTAVRAENVPPWAVASQKGCSVKAAKDLAFARINELKIQILEVLYLPDDENKSEIAAQELAQFLLTQGVMVRVLKLDASAASPKITFARIEIRKEAEVFIYVLVEKSGKRNAPWLQNCGIKSQQKPELPIVKIENEPSLASPSAQEINANLRVGEKKEAFPIELDESFDGSSIRLPPKTHIPEKILGQKTENSSDFTVTPSLPLEQKEMPDAHLLNAIDHYLDQMLWVDEMRVASLSGDMVSQTAIFMGRDRKEISLKEAILIADDDELRNRYADIVAAWNGQQMMMWTFMGSGALVSSVGLGILLAPAFVNEIPKDPWMLLGGLTMTSGLLVALGGSFFVPEILLPAEDQIQEHDIRKMVREHNERLRKELKLNLRKDHLPSGFAREVR